MSNTESNTSARTVLSPGSPMMRGGGIRATIASRMSTMPIPAFALASIASSAGMARISSNCRLHAGQVRVGQVDLVDDGHNRQPLFDGQMQVGHRLRLDPLRRIDDQQRALAGREAARNLVRKIDVPRRIEQVEPVFLPRFGGVAHRDRDAP